MVVVLIFSLRCWNLKRHLRVTRKGEKKFRLQACFDADFYHWKGWRKNTLLDPFLFFLCSLLFFSPEKKMRNFSLKDNLICNFD